MTFMRCSIVSPLPSKLHNIIVWMIESHPGYHGEYSYWVSRPVSYAILAKKQTAQSSGTVLCAVRREDEKKFLYVEDTI